MPGSAAARGAVTGGAAPGGALAAPHALEPAEVLARLGVAAGRGLDAAEVRHRRRQHGRNVVAEARRTPAWRILVDQLRGVIVWILAGAALLSFQFRNWTEGLAIVAVLAINTALGFATELRAVRSMESLRQMARVTTRVRRAGAVVEIAAQDLVPGDLVLLEAGDIVPADLRLLEAAKLACDESLLTGESVPVTKTVEALAPELPTPERRNMTWKGRAVTRGTGEGAVVAIGGATELGRIAALTEAAAPEVTPLEQRLARLSAQLVWVTLALVAAIAGAGIAAGKELLLMIETAVALAVAAIPEGLPIVATMALARGMWRMARRHALIRQLPAVETLGATTVICTDKTGTLTENRMTLVRLVLPGADVAVGPEGPAERGPAVEEALRVGVLCNNASLGPGGAAGDGTGDPMELALLVAGARVGLDRAALLARLPEVREEAFDPETKMMATVHRDGEGLLVAVKGAPEAVLPRATSVRKDGGAVALDETGRSTWLERSSRLAADGLRVLALATRRAARGRGRRPRG